MLSLEALVDRVIAESDPADVARARADFAARTGPFEPEDPWFEERTRAAFDFALCAWGQPRGALALAWASRAAEPERGAALALRRAVRGLFRVEAVRDGRDAGDGSRARLSELLGGAPLRVAPDAGAASRLREGDVFDGRVLLLDGALRLLPGLVFHPAEALAALGEVLAAARTARRSDPSILDGLLRMRMRFDRFTGMHARHVYRWDAIDKTEILAASWARPKS